MYPWQLNSRKNFLFKDPGTEIQCTVLFAAGLGWLLTLQLKQPQGIKKLELGSAL